MSWKLLLVSLALMAHAEASFFPAQGPAASTIKSRTGGVQAQRALSLIDSFETQMAPLVASRGGKLRLVVELESAKVNAEALRLNDDWMIVVFGGLLRHPRVTEAELLMVLCHELGHHLGGAPTAARGGWSACEGQADYWSTQACFLGVLPREDAVQVALNLTQLYATQTSGAMPDLTCRDLRRPSRTHFGYPSPQCRLDTLVAGLAGEERPSCWFVSEH
jgi:hypothetical protein